jgi:AcrR family transcriptional regulator
VPKVSAEHREKVRRRLLDAAGAVVARDGHEGATTRAILEEADMSAGTLYNYFSSKEELFEALIEDVVSVNVTLFDLQEAGIREFVEMLMREPDSPAMAWFRGRMSTDPDLQAAYRRLNRYIVDVFVPRVRDEQTAGRLEPDLDGDALVELVDILFDGMNRRHALDTFVTSYERVGAAFLAMLDRSVIAGRSTT